MERQYEKGFELIQDLVNKRWVPEILHSMEQGNRTYTEILESIDYLSHTELQRKLKLLEEYGAVGKEKDGYRLKDLGKDLDHIFSHFVELGCRYLIKDCGKGEFSGSSEPAVTG